MSKKRRGSRSNVVVSSRRPNRTASERPGRPIGRLLVIGAAAIGAAALLVVIFVGSLSATSYSCSDVPDLSRQAADGTPVTIEPAGARHVATGTKIRYTSCPPTSGDHYAAAGAGPLRQGFYGPTSPAEPGGWVHNLEHGYVVALYRGEPEPATIVALRDFARTGPATASSAACGVPTKVVVARFDDMSTPYALLAWGRLLPLATWDDAKARAFAQQAIDATAPEPRAC